jgi:hypothetical protein
MAVQQKIESKTTKSFLGTLTTEQIRQGKERFLFAINEAKPQSIKKAVTKKKGRELAI